MFWPMRQGLGEVSPVSSTLIRMRHIALGCTNISTSSMIKQRVGGFEQLFDNDLRWMREQRAYGREIEFVESQGYHDVADDLRALRNLERQRIFGEIE
jgi:hypothetical protein